MGANIVILKKKLKRDNGKEYPIGTKLAVDLIRARSLVQSGHIDPLEQPAKEGKPAPSKSKTIDKSGDKTETNIKE